jgi:hypothetical protein
MGSIVYPASIISCPPASVALQSELLCDISFALEEFHNASLADQMAGADDHEEDLQESVA